MVVYHYRETKHKRQST